MKNQRKYICWLLKIIRPLTVTENFFFKTLCFWVLKPTEQHRIYQMNETMERSVGFIQNMTCFPVVLLPENRLWIATCNANVIVLKANDDCISGWMVMWNIWSVWKMKPFPGRTKTENVFAMQMNSRSQLNSRWYLCPGCHWNGPNKSSLATIGIYNSSVSKCGRFRQPLADKPECGFSEKVC